MECCGIDNYTEFSQATHWGYNETTRKIPYICCKNTSRSNTDCVQNATTNNSNIGEVGDIFFQV